MGLLTKPEDLKSKKTFKGLVYGQPGIGKTTLALSAPKPVCIDFDKGIDRVQPQFRVASLQVESYQHVIDLINSDEISEFETIVIDTLGKLVDYICDHVAKENPRLRQGDGQMSMKGWGSVKNTFQTFFKLLSSKDKSIIFVAHESEEKNGDEAIKRPDCAGGARKDIVKELDFMGYMEIIGNKRTISFSPSSKYYAKNSLGLNECIEVQDTNKGNFFISEKIVKLTQEKMQENANLRAKYNEILGNITTDIDTLKNSDDVNSFYEKLENSEVIWDSKFVAKNKLSQKIKEINVLFDKNLKKFVENQESKDAANHANAA